MASPASTVVPVKPLALADTSTPVLVVNLTWHGPLCLVRSLGRLGIPVYGLHSRDSVPVQYSRYLRRVWRWDFPSCSEGALGTLAQISSELGGRAILIPTSDETAIFVSEHHAALHPWFVLPKQPLTLPRNLSDKKEMYFLAKKHGIPTPETVFPQNRDDVLKLATAAMFPLVLKATRGALAGPRTGKSMVIVHDIAELLKYYDDLEDPSEPLFMLQEYIPGGDDTIWMFNGYFNETSDCLFGVTGKKIRQQPVGGGYTSLGICLKNDVVDQTTRHFMKTIGYRGIVDIGYRWDGRDRQYKLLDINPRIGSTFRLFTAENGLDVARALYLDLTGQSVPESRVCEGRKWMVEVADFESCLQYRRQGQLSIRTWLRSFRGVQEVSFFALEDTLPFLSVVFNSAWHLLRKLLPTRSVRRAVLSGSKPKK